MRASASAKLVMGGFALVMLLGAGSPAPPFPAPRRWALVYAGSRVGHQPPYTVAQFTNLLTFVDSTGRPESWLCTGAIFLHLYAASGRTFTTWIGGDPANGADWMEYLDSLFVPGGALSRLDSAAALARGALGPSPAGARVPVAIMIPYPEPKVGRLEFGGAPYNLGRASGRSGAASAYVAEAVRRFRAGKFDDLELDGFYWLLEAAPRADGPVIERVAREIHSRGLRFLWIPYYEAENWNRWRTLGFDEAWLQPNFFFDTDIPESRLDSAAVRAARNDMGLEVEFDGRAYADLRYRGRLNPYLAILDRHPELRARSIALYEGGGGLLHLARSLDPLDRALYEQLSVALR